jgi:hypothetical protein
MSLRDSLTAQNVANNKSPDTQTLSKAKNPLSKKIKNKNHKVPSV